MLEFSLMERQHCFKGQTSLKAQRGWGPELEGDLLETQLGASARGFQKEATSVSRGMVGGVQVEGVVIMAALHLIEHTRVSKVCRHFLFH